jgi:putative glutamine amidotransferase
MIAENSTNPRIGVPYRTRNEEVSGKSDRMRRYLDSVRQAGGDPVEISLGHSAEELQKLAATLDAVLLTGSPADIDPGRFGALREPQSADCDVDRERTDFALLEHCFAEKKPLLAICFGIQSLNVFLSGTLIQDIPTDVGTSVRHDFDSDLGEPEAFHTVQIEHGSRLEQLAGASEALVNSSHHQSIREPGRGLRVVSRAPDGVIEAVEWIDGPPWIMGVQWHPERMTGADGLAQTLFREFVGVAQARKIPARAQVQSPG